MRISGYSRSEKLFDKEELYECALNKTLKILMRSKDSQSDYNLAKYILLLSLNDQESIKAILSEKMIHLWNRTQILFTWV